jgi:hypothetical protein
MKSIITLKKIFFVLLTAALFLLSFSLQKSYAQTPYKASVGAMLYGNAAGPSFKAFLTDNVAFQTDFLYKVTVTGHSYLKEDLWGENKKETDPVLYSALEACLNLVYQNKLKKDDSSNWFWFVGGGVSLGHQYVGANGKFGTNVIIGLEYVFKKPIAIQIEFRPGYAMLYNSTGEIEMVWFQTEKNPWSHFDWLVGFTLRYTFKKKL